MTKNKSNTKQSTSKKSEAKKKADSKIIVLADGTIKRKGPGRPPKTPIKKEHYVDGQQFMQEIKDFYKTDCGGEDITDELAIMIYSIANRLAFAPNFINYTYREEMVGDAVEKMFKALIAKKFDTEKGYAPFSYFTKISFNAFRNRIKKEKKAREAILHYQEEVFDILIDHNYINDTKHNNHHSIDQD